MLMREPNAGKAQECENLQAIAVVVSHPAKRRPGVQREHRSLKVFGSLSTLPECYIYRFLYTRRAPFGQPQRNATPAAESFKPVLVRNPDRLGSGPDPCGISCG